MCIFCHIIDTYKNRVEVSFCIAYREKLDSYHEINDVNCKGTLSTFKQWLALKIQVRFWNFYCSAINILI